MATLNELIAQLNASSDNILADAGRLNTTANNMNQTLNNMGVQEISGIEGLVPDTQDQYKQTMYTEQVPTTLSNNITTDSTALVPNIIDQNKNLTKFGYQKNDGIMSQIKDYFKGGGMFGMVANMFSGEMDPRAKALRNYYGYNNIGQVPSGLMQGYNPVSGGLLNMLTGGRFGEPTNYGLQRAYQKRMDTINKTLARKYADGDYSNTLLDERLVELRNLRDAEQKFVADKIGQNYTGDQDTQNVIDNTGRRDATGGAGTAAQDQFSNKTGRGRTGY